MKVPQYVQSKIVEPSGKATAQWEILINQLLHELQTNFSNEGLVTPSQNTSNRNVIETGALPGTMLYDTETQLLYYRENNIGITPGVFVPIQEGGLAVLSIDGTASDISASRAGQVVTIDMINTAVTPGTYMNATVTFDQKGRATFASSGTAPITSILGTANEITATTVSSTAPIAIAPNAILPGTASLTLPSGGTSARPATPVNGMIRYNSDSGFCEVYVGAWANIDTAGGTVISVSGTTNRITSTGGVNPVIDIDAGYVGQTSITTLGTVGTGAWNASLIPMAFGGTNANLTAASNNLVYSTSSALTLLATANNGILVTSNVGAPSISSTLPQAVQANITEVGTITIGTWNGFRLDTDYGGTGLSISTITDGQLLIGSTSGNSFALATLTPGTGVSISNSSHGITISATGTGGTVTSVTGTTGQIDVANSTTTPVISIDSGYIGQTSINTLGTIATGTWNGSLITGTYGGTGVNNGAKTITLGGNLTTSGAFNSTFTMTATTAVTFPTSGTLATTSQLPVAAALTAGNDTNVTLTLSGTPATALLQAASVTAGWTGTLALARGGLGAALTASNGGIFYSTASAGAILAGTATANQILLSGASTTPAWSTATYPPTTTINQLLYSSSANTIAGLATGNNGALITSAGGVPSISSTLPASVQGNITTLGILTTDTTIRETSTKAFSVQNATPATIFTVDSSTPAVLVGASGTNVAMNLNVNQCPNTTVYMFTVSVPSTANNTTTVAFPSGKGISNIRFMNAIAIQTSSVGIPPNYPFNAATQFSFFANASNMGIVTGTSWSTAATVYLWVWFA